jgi:hypothetical protein
MPLLLLPTKGHYPLGRLAGLKHVFGLTKQAPKTLPTMTGAPAQIHTHTHTHTHTHNMYTISVCVGGGGLDILSATASRHLRHLPKRRWRDAVAERMLLTKLEN